MRNKSGGRWRSAFAFASTLVLGCGASGTASEAGGASGADANAASGSSAHPGGSNAGGTQNAHGGATQAGDGGATQAGDGGTTQAGDGGTTQAGDGGDGGDAGTAGTAGMFVNQIEVGQGGGPPKCLPRTLPTGLPGTASDGQASCIVAELKAAPCDCLQPARAALPGSSLSALEKLLQANGSCGGTSGVSCDTLCGCEITQAAGTASDQTSALYACQNEVAVAAGVNGFCVIDQLRTDAAGAPVPLGNPDIVSECPSNWKRLLRFVGAGSPASSANVFLSCTGAAL